MKQRALIDVNMLVDTRIGTIKRISPKAANLIVQSEWYKTRDTDNFSEVSNGIINNEVYKKMYLAYDVESLAGGYMTEFLIKLREDIKRGVNDLERIHNEVSFEFEVNYYPYDLLPEEVVILERVIARYLPISATVKMVSIDLKELDPITLSARYDMMALYNYEDWLRHHQESLDKHPITQFCLITPRISPSGIVPKPDSDIRDPFMAVPMLLCRVIQLIVVPSEWACVNYALFKKLGNDIATSE